MTSTGAVELDARLVHAAGRRRTVLTNMMLGEITPGGVGSGLYGILVIAVVTVFVAGLMVGRTPEYLGKKIRAAGDEVRRALHPGHAGGRRWSGPAVAMAIPSARARCSTPGRTGCRRCCTRSPRRRTTTAARSPG